MAIRYHPDPEIQEALAHLHDVLSSRERTTGREVMVLVIPIEEDEPILMSSSGIPLRMEYLTDDTIVDIVKSGLKKHWNPKIHAFTG